MPDDDPLALAGRRLLDRYRVERCLAHGGMSVVHQGTDERLGRPVSIKIYNPADPSSPTYRAGYEHFLGEVAALARLRHPHTLRLYDVGFLESEGHPFHVCEYVDGGTLRGEVKRHGPLPVAAAMTLLEPILGALDEAHACGLVHADVKPANVLLVDVGGQRLAKLADFGISRRLAIASAAVDTQPDVTGMRLFSPGWAAPEQIRGESVSPATDVFGAGLLFAFTVTGKRVLPTGELVGLVEHRGNVDAFIDTMFDRLCLPAELRSVLGHACRADPDMRFSRIVELRAALLDASARVANAPPSSVDSETTARFQLIA